MKSLRAANSTPRRRHVRAGFTLLEILIASLLSATLLALLWGTFNMYLRLFETGERATHEAELLFGLHRQFREGIQAVPAAGPPATDASALSFSALPTPLATDGTSEASESSAAGSGESELWDDEPLVEEELSLGAASLGISAAVTLPTFGIVGSNDRLTLYGIQLMPSSPAEEETTTEQLATLRPEDEVPPGASELRIVHYRFLQPSRSPNRSSPGTRGLVRLETAWHQGHAHTWTDEQIEEFLAYQDEGEDQEAVEQQIARVRREREGLGELDPEQLVLIPDVAGIKFRYYDGLVWQDSWNSRLEKRLPLAVEVYVQLREDERILRRRARGTSDPEGSSLENSQDALNRDPSAVDPLSESLEENWNTLESFAPEESTQQLLSSPSTQPIHRWLFPCAGATSDALASRSSEASAADGPQRTGAADAPPLPSREPFRAGDVP